MSENKKGLLIVISGPAGSGKGTVIKNLLDKSPDFAYSISATTRNPRPGEINGKHYHFISREEFENRIYNNTMLEYTEYCGNYYGTPKKEVDDCLNSGLNVILEIEVKGAMQIKQKLSDVLLLLILPLNYKMLESRLRGRATESEEVILQRLDTAIDEMKYFENYDYVVVNNQNQHDVAADNVIKIVYAEKFKTSRNQEFYKSFFN